MYPTLFGLHLAEELTLGHENVLEDGIFVGVRKFELRWKAAREQEMLTLSADGRDALSKCLALLKSRMDVVYACDTRSDNIAKIDSKSKKKLMHRLSKLTTDEAPADSDISTRNTLTVIEDVGQYQVRIKTDSRFLKDGSFAADMERGDPYIVVLKNSRNGSTSFSKTLRFACGININSSNIKLSRKRGTIEANFTKDPSFTHGNRPLPWKKLDAGFIVDLPDFPRSEFGEDSVECYVRRMHPQPVPDLQTATPLQQFQSIVLYLMKTVPFSFGVPAVVSIRVPSQADPNRVNNRFYLEGLKIYENKPTLFLTFIDMDKMTQLQEEIPPFLPLLLEGVELDPQSAKYLAPGFSLLMQILELNSYRRAQAYCQEPDKRWLMRTYLRARYPYTDYQTYKMTLSGMPEDYIKLISLLRSQLPTRSEDVAPRPSTHSCDSCGRTSTECKKCTGCHLVYYCDRACQKKAWPEHKHVCRRT